MKHITTFLLVSFILVSGAGVFLLVAAPHAQADPSQYAPTDSNGNPLNSQFVPLAPIPGLTDTRSTQGSVLSGNFGKFFNQLYQYLIGLSVALAIIWIIWGGVLISTSDSIGNHARGRKKIEDAILGLALVLAPALVFSVINSSILNLSINFDPIDTYTPQQQTQQPPAQTPTPTGPPAGCDSSSYDRYVSSSCAGYLENDCTQNRHLEPKVTQLTDPSTHATTYKVSCAVASSGPADQNSCSQLATTSVGGNRTWYWLPGTCDSNKGTITGQPNAASWTCTPGADSHVCIYVPHS